MNIILVNIIFFYFLFGLVTATLGFWYARNELKGQRRLTLVGLFLFCIVAWVYIYFASVATQLKKRIENEYVGNILLIAVVLTIPLTISIGIICNSWLSTVYGVYAGMMIAVFIFAIKTGDE